MRSIKKLKFGKILRTAVGTAVPILKPGLEAGAAAIRQAKQNNKGVNDQAAVAITAGVNELPSVKTQRMLTYAVLGLAGVLILVSVMKRRG